MQKIKLFKELPPVVRCDNELCRRVLPLYYWRDDDNGHRYRTYLKSKGKNFCDKWCQEQVIQPKYIHTCRHCGELTEPIYRASGKWKGHITNWRIICEDCRKKKQEELEIRRKLSTRVA